ncbi:MAG TPA: LLM class flavin-dependent oxidoreductase [Actinomycetota bacterium]|nr:LLM class flavin-dependent oxidoreductase [Actinomycetota bacterium]
MNEVLVGATLPQFTDDPDRFIEVARRAEECGLDSIWVFDHIWPLTGGRERPVIECFTALAWIAAETTTIRIGTLVARSSLRHPALLAKEAATVAAIAPGRVTIAIGSGDEASRPENEAYGIPYVEAEDRIGQLASTVRVVHGYLGGSSLDHHDDFASISGLPPSPVVDPPARVWVGGRSDDVLEVAGTVADGWNGWAGTPRRFAQDAATVAGYAGDRPVELSWGGLVTLARSDDAARERFGDRSAKGWIVGGPGTVAGALGRFVEAGARHVIVTVPDPSLPDVFETLAGEVAPALA